MKTAETIAHISTWMFNYATGAKSKGFVIGLSGGIDSALVSTLCARTGLRTQLVLMPIHQDHTHTLRAERHAAWLMSQ